MEQQTPEKQAPADTKADLRRRRNEKAKRMLDVILPELENAKALAREREVQTLVRDAVEKELRKQGIDDQLAYDLSTVKRLLDRAHALKRRIAELHKAFAKLRK